MSYESLSNAEYWFGNGGGGDDDDSREAAAAAASSFLSSDIGVGEEEFYHHPPQPAAFHAEQPAPLLFDALQAETDHYSVSGIAGSSSEEGEPGKRRQSQTDASALSSEGHGNGFVSTSAGGAGRLPLPAARKKDGKEKIAFKTRSDVDVLDDGYRWRKYGKKMVKNSPNPRNYYRCSREGCQVKKRVERARDDARFVITTYDGVHNHPAPPPPPRGYHRLLDPPAAGAGPPRVF
ncbi:putative WRKY transcription factor 50 [Panicum miliaceum]|uniref:WRKY transcription factor 50 n=1 Tax=Panicum miliaceum TaxID=4540 RepID=A0A3L6ST74_PANMI|nr:putative WRKY transcription factor 50 [Panicum miliaceum]